MREDKDCSGLKVGDTAVVRFRYREEKWTPVEVIKITPSGRIYVDYQDKVFLPNGREYGNGAYSGYTLQPWDDENKASYDRQMQVELTSRNLDRLKGCAANARTLTHKEFTDLCFHLQGAIALIGGKIP